LLEEGQGKEEVKKYGLVCSRVFAGVAIAIVAEAVEGVSEAIVDENLIFDV